MNQEFLTDIEALRNAQSKVAELSESAKPWRDYAAQMVNYIIAKHFPNYTRGTHTVSLPDGATVEYENGENVAVREEMLPIVFDQMIGATERPDGVPYTNEQVAALNQLHKLVRWKPSLDKRQYDKLPEDKRKLFDAALQKTPATPKITVKDAE
jgi:hypothetical protein